MSGSADVQHLVTGDELHVARDRAGHWWAVGKLGSYGGSVKRSEAIKTAMDASASAGGNREIVVHFIHGGVACIITRVRTVPVPQWFQDSVP
jgi:hypothetical protein